MAKQQRPLPVIVPRGLREQHYSFDAGRLDAPVDYANKRRLAVVRLNADGKLAARLDGRVAPQDVDAFTLFARRGDDSATLSYNGKDALYMETRIKDAYENPRQMMAECYEAVLSRGPYYRVYGDEVRANLLMSRAFHNVLTFDPEPAYVIPDVFERGDFGDAPTL